MNHTRPPFRRLTRLLALVAAGLLGIACSSESSVDPPLTMVTTVTTAGDSTPATVDTTTPVDTTPAPRSEGDICASVPPLDVISAQLDEPVLRLERLERGPGTELCQAAGDGVANVSFSRVAQSNEQQMRELAAQLGYEVSEVGDPALPGAFTYAGAVTVFIGNAEFTVQTITLDTLSDPASPLASQRAARLLSAWLQLLGV